MRLYLCPELADRDPQAKDFDGGGHKMLITETPPAAPVACLYQHPEGDQGCDREMVEITDPDTLARWSKLTGVTFELPEREPDPEPAAPEPATVGDVPKATGGPEGA